MKNFKEKIKSNSVFLIITALVLLTAFVSTFADCIGSNPFESEYYLENPVQAVFTDSGNYYITDSSYSIAVTDENNELIYLLPGGDPDRTFDYADAAAACNGELYVHDKSYNYDGTYAYRERILKFTNSGRKREVLYEADTCDEDNIQVIYLDSPRIIKGELYFSEICEDGIYVKKCSGNEAAECAFMPLENAYDDVSDSTFDDSLNIYVSLMNGDIHTYQNGEDLLLYDASENDTDEYCSIISDVDYSSGTLYAGDIGLRKVYSIGTDGQLTEVIGQGHFSGGSTGSISEAPLYSGLNADGGNISVVSAEYSYDPVTDESEYTYFVNCVNSTGEEIFSSDIIGISPGYKVIVLCVYAAILLMAVIAVYSLIKIIGMIRSEGFAKNNTQILVLLTAIAVTAGVSLTIFNTCNERFVSESVENLSNIAYLIDATMDKETVAKLNSPDMWFDESYQALNDDILSVLKSNTNESRNVYAVIYRIHSNVICEVYRNDGLHSIMYPMAGAYANSVEQVLAESSEIYISQDYELSEGNYTFALIPSYDENGEILAFIEVGANYDIYVQENNALYKNILILSSMAVIIIMLLFAEIMNGGTAFRARHRAASDKSSYSPEIIRPVAFMVFFTANITTAFLPIYGMSLWNEDFPMPAEVAAALPLSAELIVSAISSLFCGFAIKKTGIKPMCLIGAVFYIGGNMLSAFAGNLWMLICANSICGIGGGFLTIAINSRIADFDEEENRNKGFVHYNAAFLAGMNCGTVVGSILWEQFGITAAYFTAAFCAVLILILGIMLLDNKRTVIEGKRSNASIRDFITPNLIRYFICLAIPYLICASFLSYYFPIVAEENSLSAAEISMAFLISGVISIYAGDALGEPVISKLGTRKSMILASFIYAAALLYLVFNPSIASCYIVIVLFAAADSFGLSAQSVYFSSMPEVNTIGQSRALGINSTIESITSACGSVAFGAALLLGEQKGILTIAVIFCGLLTLFVIGGGLNAKAGTSEEK